MQLYYSNSIKYHRWIIPKVVSYQLGLVFPSFNSKWCIFVQIRSRTESLWAFISGFKSCRYLDVSLHIRMSFSKYMSDIRKGQRIFGCVKKIYVIGIQMHYWDIQMSRLFSVSSIWIALCSYPDSPMISGCLIFISRCVQQWLWVVSGYLESYLNVSSIFYEWYPDTLYRIRMGPTFNVCNIRMSLSCIRIGQC